VTETLDAPDPPPPDDDDLGWQLRALRGENTSDAATAFVANVRDLLTDPHMVAALATGDRRWPRDEDPRRYAEPERWPDVDEDPAVVAELEQLQASYQADAAPEPQSHVDRLAGAVLSTAAIRALPPPSWLVDGYLVRDSLALLYGPSGTYKTFLGIDLALHVATGSWWNKRAITEPGQVLYVIAEGVAGVGARIDAWQTHHRIYDLDAHAPVSWLPRAVNLADRMEAAAFAEVAARLEPALIVLDTLARCTVGAEENSARDMGVVVEALDMIRRRTTACVLTIHHTGKEAASGARGSSALRGAMDTELEMAPGDPLVLKVTKQKDAAEPAQLHLAPLPTAESLVLTHTSNITADYRVDDRARATLAALVAIAVPQGISTGDWLEASRMPKSTFMRHRSLLIANDLVTNVGTPKVPRYMPADEPPGPPDDLPEF
jgi:hypothetical protein